NELASVSDSLAFNPKLRLLNLEPRTFLLTDNNTYDLITLPLVGTFGGGVGVNALQEQHLLTREAFQEMWEKLSPRGVVGITTWMDYPPRNPLKIFATMLEVLENKKVKDP